MKENSLPARRQCPLASVLEPRRDSLTGISVASTFLWVGKLTVPVTVVVTGSRARAYPYPVLSLFSHNGKPRGMYNASRPLCRAPVLSPDHYCCSESPGGYTKWGVTCVPRDEETRRGAVCKDKKRIESLRSHGFVVIGMCSCAFRLHAHRWITAVCLRYRFTDATTTYLWWVKNSIRNRIGCEIL